MIVDELKKAILQYAIQGKLVKQLISDSSSHQLFNNLKIEKERLVQDKSILKKKDLSEADYKVPFEIPGNWTWILLSNCSIIQEGAGIRKFQYRDNGIQLFSVTNILDGNVDLFKKRLYVSKEEYEKKYQHLTLKKGDIVTACSGGSWGKVAIYDKEATVMLNTSTLRMRFFSDIGNNKYLYYVLQSKYFKKRISDQLVGIQPNFGYEHYSQILIPLPPIEEQQRIVDKIEELFNLLNELKDIEVELDVLKSKFPEEMRKAILLCAISGNMNVNNSKEFVEGSIESTIADYAKPFEIPNNWKWYSHNDLFEVIGGSQPPKGSFSGTQKEGYIRLYQTRDYGEKPQPVYIKISDARKVTKKDDILLARYGGSLGKVFWAEEGAYNVAMVRVDIKYPEIINKKYLYYYYCADLYQKKIKSGNRSAQAGFSKEDLNDLCFPLPPIEEQQRIVEKLDYILPLIESL